MATTYTLKRKEKIFFDYGLTSADIKAHATKNNMSVKDAYAALKSQKAGQGVNVTAHNEFSKSAYKASGIKAANDSAGVVGRSGGGGFLANKGASSQVKTQASQNFNLGKTKTAQTVNSLNAAKTTGYNAGMAAGKNSATLNKQVLQNTWKNMGTAGKVGVGAGAVALGALAVRGLTAGKKKEKSYSFRRIIK